MLTKVTLFFLGYGLIFHLYFKIHLDNLKKKIEIQEFKRKNICSDTLFIHTFFGLIYVLIFEHGA